jgi:EpsI family protein
MTAGFAYWSDTKTPSIDFSAKLANLPMNIDKWHGRDVALTGVVRNALNADDILSRQYLDPVTQQRLGLLIVYRKYGRRDFAHRPELCYPASGYELPEKTYTTVPYNGKDVSARMVVAEKNDTREIVMYWFASGNRTESNYVKQQLWMSLDRLQKQKYGWAFIRVNVPVIYNNDASMDAARDFLHAAEEPLMKVLKGG